MPVAGGSVISVARPAGATRPDHRGIDHSRPSGVALGVHQVCRRQVSRPLGVADVDRVDHLAVIFQNGAAFGHRHRGVVGDLRGPTLLVSRPQGFECTGHDEHGGVAAVGDEGLVVAPAG